MTKTFLSAATALLFMTAASPAQTITISPRGDAASSPLASRAQPLRVQVSIQIASPFPNGASTDDQDKIISTARERLYRSAASECQVLSEVFKSECRLTSVNASSTIQDRGSAPVVNANGNATYELQLRER